MLTSHQIAAVQATLAAQAGEVTASLNLCFHTGGSLSVGQGIPLQSEAPGPELSGAGLVLSFRVEGSTVLAVLPANLPLPAWYAFPDAAQAARIKTLADEWSVNAIPPELAAECPQVHTVQNLWSFLQECRPAPNAVAIPGDLGDGRRLWFVLPVERAPEPSSDPPVPRILRVLKLPVQVIVQLARKKVELGSLRDLAPGSMVMFEKSCEDLLDLYVNNRLFCRGEAVKVGEKFGLKINEVGPVEERLSAVIDR